MIGLETKYILAAVGLTGAVLLAILGAWLLLIGWPLLVAIALFVVFAVIILVLVVGVLIFVLAVPMYFVKEPKTQDGSYSIDDVRSIKEDEKK